MFISIDPGKNVGAASFHPDGTDYNKTSMDEKEFRVFLRRLVSMAGSQPDLNIVFIMEDFKLRFDKAIDQTGSNMPASRIIGAVQMVDEILQRQSSIVLQQPGILHTALKWAGYSKLANKPRSYHVPDEISAYSHGVYYLINKGLRKHPIFDEV